MTGVCVIFFGYYDYPVRISKVVTEKPFTYPSAPDWLDGETLHTSTYFWLKLYTYPPTSGWIGGETVHIYLPLAR